MKKSKTGNPIDAAKENLPGYPSTPPEQDIFNKGIEETEIDPENISKNKTANDPDALLNEKDFEDDVTGDDLDVPGTDDDDAMEDIGSEDEENNLYSLGGDNHDD